MILNNHVTAQEVLEVINWSKSGKSPGPDGLTAKYYKKLSEQLVNPLKDVMIDVLKTGEIPGTWKEAYITVIPKHDSDLMQIKNYRHISLINNDYKLFANILANRLKHFLGEYIHQDQAGFIPGGDSSNNVYRCGKSF